ncbi:hypothetical protein GOP47_0024121 [Adiantum capillus-veneris]|uniref:Mitochondrial ATP synthase subunit G protein n=1 Tax=Adiantum capillus-veneris TaxID=13818 RepID=A0A9D4U4M4_ADICA|nr:hypothetical protein GOP47_0023510 [Adiantum capillus-veneris]KAI5061616.1 hypothetical protein GOP47_0024121 [Adiantum capillus-veneris]
MASFLKSLQGKAKNIQGKTRQLISTHGSSYYNNLLESNKQYIAKEPTIDKCQELSKQLFYTRLASIPGRYEKFWKEVEFLKNKLKDRQDLTVEDVGVAALFAAECYCWFSVGEIIGRGFTFTGYYP